MARRATWVDYLAPTPKKIKTYSDTYFEDLIEKSELVMSVFKSGKDEVAKYFKDTRNQYLMIPIFLIDDFWKTALTKFKGVSVDLSEEDDCVCIAYYKIKSVDCLIFFFDTNEISTDGICYNNLKSLCSYHAMCQLAFYLGKFPSDTDLQKNLLQIFRSCVFPSDEIVNWIKQNHRKEDAMNDPNGNPRKKENEFFLDWAYIRCLEEQIISR